MSSAANLEVYNRSEVANHYAQLEYLTPCERYLFDLYIKPGAAILDLGVGGGRTTPFLSRQASRYVGVDYAPQMIHSCREKYPGLEFREAQASDLSTIATGSFDALVCAFNGLDYVIPDESRRLCFDECWRVLKPGGVFLFSSHNPRSILVRPVWNKTRIRAIADNVRRRSRFAGNAASLLLTMAAGSRASLRAAWTSASRTLARVPGPAFWRGEGYVLDSAHGGLLTHCWVPERVVCELQDHGFHVERVLGDDYPEKSHPYVTDWFYYVFSKLISGESAICA